MRQNDKGNKLAEEILKPLSPLMSDYLRVTNKCRMMGKLQHTRHWPADKTIDRHAARNYPVRVIHTVTLAIRPVAGAPEMVTTASTSGNYPAMAITVDRQSHKASHMTGSCPMALPKVALPQSTATLIGPFSHSKHTRSAVASWMHRPVH